MPPKKGSKKQASQGRTADDNGGDTGIGTGTGGSKSKRKLRSELDALHAEMEVAKYAVNHYGRSRRKISRQESKVRTIKRKFLEKHDAKLAAIDRSDGGGDDDHGEGGGGGWGPEGKKSKRMRGSRAALEDDVVQGSLIFDYTANKSTSNATGNEGGKDGNESDGDSDSEYNHEEEVDYSEEEQSVDEDDSDDSDGEGNGQEDDEEEEDEDAGDDSDEGEGRYELYADELNIDIDDIDDSDGGASDYESYKRNKKKRSTSKSSRSKSKGPMGKSPGTISGGKVAKTMYKLKNFKSIKMAQKHGEALGAHARGLNVSAVSKLKAVASAAPVAPQIYSSLGLVYESMLTEAKKADDIRSTNHNDGKSNESESKAVRERIKLAKKAFASYHVAALLCKMDHSLWIRAGDAALMVADLHSVSLDMPPVFDDDENAERISESLHLPQDPAEGLEADDQGITITTVDEYIKYHDQQRKHWLEEAKNDFQTADNLHPPGISVPCKLAHVQMELGHLSEALTILTDLKNISQRESEALARAAAASPEKGIDKDAAHSKSLSKARARTELEKSFSAWLLYADLMLVIGHECIQWNRGIHTNGNYMFRRWLRKYSEHFDWQERRFQALSMALEAAAGTKSCQNLLIWIKDRTLRMKASHGNDFDGPVDRDQSGGGDWEVCDTYEIDRRLQRQKDTENTGDETGKSTMEKGSEGTNISKDAVSFANQSGGNATNTDANHIVPASEQTNDVEELSRNFNRDREAMLVRIKSDLSAFDSETQGMNIVEASVESELREKQRESLSKKHKKLLIDLAAAFQKEKKRLEDHQSSEFQSSVGHVKALHVSATCVIVCDIAAQLVKQCLAMDLYKGGILACEAVSLYLQERAIFHERRISSRESYDARKAYNGKSMLQLDREHYDDISDGGSDSDSDSEESSIMLSDDEDFNSLEGEKLIQKMKNGMLTPELQVLYGLSLISDDRMPFLAAKLLEAMTDLDSGDSDSLELLPSDESDALLKIFRKTMTDPMSKLDAFAFSTDVLRKSKKEENWADLLLPTFELYIEELENEDAFNLLKQTSAQGSLSQSVKKKNYLKIMLSTFRMKLGKALRSTTNKEGTRLGFDLCMDILDKISLYQEALWGMKPDGNPLPTSVELLDILSSVFSLAISCLEDDDQNDGSDLHSLMEQLKIFTSLICQIDLNDLYSCKSGLLSDTWRHFPITSGWQTDELSIMSRSAYNLLVSCSVSSFSGWEREEFTLNLLKKNRKNTFFGVDIAGQRVTGWMSDEATSYLSQLWQKIESLIPTLSALDFDNAAMNVKKSDWYQKAVQHLETEFKGIPIACHGEESALNILFIFAHAALLMAKHEQDDVKTEVLLKYALSILLPTTQFCLDQSLWDSELGVKGTDENAEWQVFAAGESTFTPKPRSKSTKRSSSVKISSTHRSSNGTKTRHNSYMSKSPFKKLVKVSAEILLREWNGKETFEQSDEDDEDEIDARLNKWSDTVSGPSKLAMKRLDYNIHKLRQCSTINSLQKASLQVSLSLLDVASQKECRNPFICLSQAAIFASQGAKGGNNDEEFKKPLSSETECTPEEALQILGRADCLRAIHFINEAIFLCSFAARVCCLHRDKKEPEHSWTPKWRIVGIMSYTISLGIDSAIYSLMEGDDRKVALDSWEKSVKAELGRGRSDAIAMQKACGLLPNAPSLPQRNINQEGTNMEQSTSEGYGSSENEDGFDDQDEDEDGDDEHEMLYEDEFESDDNTDKVMGDQANVDDVPPLPNISSDTEMDADYLNIPTVAL